MTRSRGTVVVAADPFGHTPRRPYLLLSDDSHPFAGEQYVALGITTKEYGESLRIGDAFERGELSRTSFVSPWAAVSLAEADIERAVARLSDAFTDRCAERLTEYVTDA